MYRFICEPNASALAHDMPRVFSKVTQPQIEAIVDRLAIAYPNDFKKSQEFLLLCINRLNT